jgi:enterochelin esterase-like enzyme
MTLLLFNDGQDLESIGLSSILQSLQEQQRISPILAVGIHAGARRKWEYGIAGRPDYKGRGSQAEAYTQFILEELIPLIRVSQEIEHFREIAFAGFSLGGLSALDIVWKHPTVFSKAGVFSGSFWWRSKDKNDPEYSDAADRLMHETIRNGQFADGLKFFFECGGADEEEDRNQNGVIDSIDDTLDLIKELEAKGYQPNQDLYYLELDEGKHDIATWAQAMPSFLLWGWGHDTIP